MAANPGPGFRDALIALIASWNIPHLEIFREPFVGSRFVGKKRYVDIVLRHREQCLGIEAKTQQTSGTAFQKLSYTLEDARRTPIPMLIVFSGQAIEADVKAMLISSGIGIEMDWSPGEGFRAEVDVLRQRIMIELHLDWLADQEARRVQ